MLSVGSLVYFIIIFNNSRGLSFAKELKLRWWVFTFTIHLEGELFDGC